MSVSEPMLFVVGVTHHTAPMELREKLALGPDKLTAFQQQVVDLPGLTELAILNTCNRIEFYGVAADHNTLDALRDTFCTSQGIEPAAFDAIRLHRSGAEVIDHLTAVSAGLESQLIGENEIFGQVKAAYAEAQKTGKVGSILHKVFQKTFQAAKQVRTETAISEGQVSIANVAVDLATSIFGDLGDARILLAGAGEIGEQSAKAFRSRGASRLTVTSRTMDSAMALAESLDGVALPFDKLPTHLAEFDIIVCATAAPGAILTHDAIKAAMRKRPAAPLFLIDLALPRDIDPSTAEIDNVYLYNLDDLAQISNENRAARESETEKARALISEKSSYLWKSLSRRNPSA